MAAALADKAAWRCDGVSSEVGADRVFLAFQVPRDAGEQRFFSTRSTLLDGLTLAVVRDGRILASEYRPVDAIVADGLRGTLAIALPVAARPGDTVVAALDVPIVPGQMQDARLTSDPAKSTAQDVRFLVIAALVCGMLFMPLAFNAAFYRVLRERFVFWHMLLTAGLLVQCLTTSGLLGLFVDVSLPVFFRMGVLSFGLAIAAAAAFGASFIEPDKLDPRLRRGLYAASAQVMVVSCLQVAFPHALGGIQSKLYYASFIPVVAIFLAVSFDAWRKGSRAVRYQLIGWAPFLAVGVIRIATMLVPGAHQSEATTLFYVAMVVESIAVSLGVGDRFMAIKRQRDRAMTRVDVLARLSERDDLTGLYNRRALEGPLGEFAVQEFTGFALFDLDNFKRVNDSHGHAVGDEVLKVVAGVLAAHDNAVALRLGGEEFLLLLRGDRVSERVERLRESIPVRIAREVQALDMLVTSSAGLVEAPDGKSIGTDFAELYQTTDALLYEAKHHGRNLLAAATLPVAREEADLAISAA